MNHPSLYTIILKAIVYKKDLHYKQQKARLTGIIL
jgi:hypothetical protein